MVNAATAGRPQEERSSLLYTVGTPATAPPPLHRVSWVTPATAERHQSSPPATAGSPSGGEETLTLHRGITATAVTPPPPSTPGRPSHQQNGTKRLPQHQLGDHQGAKNFFSLRGGAPQEQREPHPPHRNSALPATAGSPSGGEAVVNLYSCTAASAVTPPPRDSEGAFCNSRMVPTVSPSDSWESLAGTGDHHPLQGHPRNNGTPPPPTP